MELLEAGWVLIRAHVRTYAGVSCGKQATGLILAQGETFHRALTRTPVEGGLNAWHASDMSFGPLHRGQKEGLER